MYRIKYKDYHNKLNSDNFVTLQGIVISCSIDKDDFTVRIIDNKTNKLLYKTKETSIVYAQKYIRNILMNELKLPIFEEARKKKHEVKKKKLVKDLFTNLS